MPKTIAVIDVSSLYVSAIDTTPVLVDSWTDIGGEDGDGFTSWEAFDYDLGDTTYTLVTINSSVHGVVIGDTLYTAWDDYESDWEDDHYDETQADEYDGPPIAESDFDALMQVEPYMYGAEGPMMNYYYPVEIDDPAETAAKLAHVPLCVVEVNGSTALALTGGGMDMSWDICRAFIMAGYLPPAHFADLPRQGEDDPIVIRKDWTVRALERLDQLANG